ncbi:POC1 centriolar protein like protein A [Cyphomyrmex costatus]|uniref:POC1 centriolar protein like protein A n=1 Tax=Cyphomyrmex costatus TaxID=456900 RepID=A0A195CB87_9HYME|nr:POC1 centriolar protein like protein A [Cyphomyrmex costatus]
MEENVFKYPYLYRELEGHNNNITALSFHPIQTNKLVSSSLDRTLGLWRTDKPKGKRFEVYKADILDVCYSPDGGLIASASKDKCIKIWDSANNVNFTYKGHDSAVRSVQFNPEGDRFVSASNDKNIILWILHREKYFETFKGHTNWVRCAKFSQNGKLLASCSDDKTIKIWDITSGQCVKTFVDAKVPTRYVEFHPTDTVVGSANADGSIKLYDLRTDLFYHQSTVHIANVNMIKFHPNGNFMLTASDDFTTKVLDFPNGCPISTFKEHYAEVTSITFSNDGKFFASGGTDQRILIWKCNDLFVDDQSIEIPIQLMSSTTASTSLMSDIKQEFNGDETLNKDEHEDVFEKQDQKNDLLNESQKSLSDSNNSAELRFELEKLNLTDVESSQGDHAKNVLAFPQQSHSSKQSQTDSENQISFKTFSINQSIEMIDLIQIFNQIQLLHHNYDVLVQRLETLEELFKKNVRKAPSAFDH